MLDRRRAGAAAEFGERGFPLTPVFARYPDFDELMGPQMRFHFGNHGVGHPVAADEDDGAQVVGAGPEGAALGGSKGWH